MRCAGGPAAPGYEAVPPRGNSGGNSGGNDLFGVIDESGDAVPGFPIGDAVFDGKRIHVDPV